LISKGQLIGDLKKLGINEGDHLGVALSLKSIGYVDGGPDAFIDALLEAVGPNGTIMMPTYNRSFHLSEINTKLNKKDHIFDPSSTKADTGLVPNTLIERKEAIRSKHPTHSVTAIGEMAKNLTEEYDKGLSPYSPYSKLAKIGGKVLCIGINDRIVAIRHEAQFLAGLLNVVPPRRGIKFRNESKNIKIFIFKNAGGCTRRLPELVNNIRKRGLLKEGQIGSAKALLINARDFLEITSKLLRNNPTLNLCNHCFCFWCRELERRMRLYDRIENPRYFQRYAFIIKLIAFINGYRLRNHIIDKIFRKLVGISAGVKSQNQWG
jgi:aminoglycoside N3'-acetyltransferase